MRNNNANKIIIAHLNMNSVGNKFDISADIVKDNVDILMISESQLDDFPDGQFLKERFGKPFHLNRNRNGGGIMFFFEAIEILWKVFMLN